MKKIAALILSIVLLWPQSTQANTWYFTNNNVNYGGTDYKSMEASFSGGGKTYRERGNWSGEQVFSNRLSNKWAIVPLGENATIPAGNWTFSLTTKTNKKRWYPRIKIYDSSGSLIHTSTSPTFVDWSDFAQVSWSDYVPEFSVGAGQYYVVELYSYRDQKANRTDQIGINSDYQNLNYIIDTYVSGGDSYSPYTRSWRWYDDAGSLNPSVPLAGENMTPTGMYNGNQVRLRETISELDGGDQTGRKKMQYSSDSVNFSDVGAIGSGDPWAYCDGGGTDDSLVSSLLVSTSDTYGPFVENGTAGSSFTHQGNTMAEFDFCLQENFALTNQTYYFRVVDVESGNPIYPEATYNWPTITVSDHGLNVEMLNDFEISALNMDDAPGPTTGGFTNIKVMDYRGTQAGWSLTATATDLVRDGGSETIDIENIGLTATTVSAEYAESTTGISTGSGSLSNTVPLNIATASAGNGVGNFFISGDISFTVPVASVPGDYTGTVTLTVS